MFRRRFWTAAAVAAVAILYSGSRADAGFQVTLVSPGGNLTVADGSGFDSNATANVIEVTTIVGGYTFTGSFASSNVDGTPTISFLNTGLNSVTGTQGGTIQIIASANGYTEPVSPPDLRARSGGTFQVGADSDAASLYEVSYKAYLDAGNGLSDASTIFGSEIGSGGPDDLTLNGDDNADFTDNRIVAGVGAPYSLTLVLNADVSGGSFYSLDMDGTLRLQPVPAPGALVLLGTAVPFFGLLRRRLRRTETPVAA